MSEASVYVNTKMKFSALMDFTQYYVDTCLASCDCDLLRSKERSKIYKVPMRFYGLFCYDLITTSNTFNIINAVICW